jgi:hypothetical protein
MTNIVRTFPTPYPSYGYSYPIGDGETVTGLSNLVADSSEILFVKSGAGYSYDYGFVRNEEYIYFQNNSSSIREYKISDGTTTDVDISSYIVQTNLPMCFVEERKIVFMGDGSTNDYVALYLLDFSVLTITKLTEFLMEVVIDTYTTVYIDFWAGFLLCTVYEDKTYLIMTGWANLDFDNGVDVWNNMGYSFAIYNYTDETSTLTYEMHHDVAHYQQNYVFSVMPIITNGKIALTGYTFGYGDLDYKCVAFHIFDLNTLTQTVVRQEGFETWQSPFPSGFAPDHINNAVWAYVSGGAYPVTYYLVKIDLDTLNLTIVETSSNSIYYLFCVGQNETYIYKNTTATWYTTSLVPKVTITPPTDGYHEGDNFSYVFDDIEGRTWFYDSTGPNLTGIRISDGDIKEISTDITYPTISPRQMGVYLLGDCVILAKRFSATNTTTYYLIKSTSGSGVIPSIEYDFQVIMWQGI